MLKKGDRALVVGMPGVGMDQLVQFGTGGQDSQHQDRRNYSDGNDALGQQSKALMANAGLHWNAVGHLYSGFSSGQGHRFVCLQYLRMPRRLRSVRRGLYDGGLDGFQRARLAPGARLLRRVRTLTAGRAAHIVCPSAYLRAIVLTWGISPDRVSVLPNTVPRYDDLPPREALRARFGIDGKTLVCAGRLTRQKALDVTFAAVAELDDVQLLVAGTGEERPRLEALAGPRVRFVGALTRREATELVAAADGAVLSSSWETGRPFSVVEALSVGTPVIATRVGGTPEVVTDGVNGLLVEPGDPAALADALRRFFADDDLRRRLAAAAAGSVSGLTPELVLTWLEDRLLEAAGRPGS